MKKENELNFQSYDYEDKTYYLPKITNVKEILTQAKEKIKSEDDFRTQICTAKNNPKIINTECVNAWDCSKIGDCLNCFLYIDNKKKLDAFNSFLKENNYEELYLEKSNLPITNDELCKAIACIESIDKTIHDYDSDFIEEGKIDNLKEIKRNLPQLKKFVQYLVER